MKKTVRLALTATLTIALVLGLFQFFTVSSFIQPLKTCVGWNCNAAASAEFAPTAAGQLALAIKLPPVFLPNVGWNS